MANKKPNKTLATLQDTLTAGLTVSSTERLCMLYACRVGSLLAMSVFNLLATATGSKEPIFCMVNTTTVVLVEDKSKSTSAKVMTLVGICSKVVKSMTKLLMLKELEGVFILMVILAATFKPLFPLEPEPGLLLFPLLEDPLELLPEPLELEPELEPPELEPELEPLELPELLDDEEDEEDEADETI